ncbi:MAG: DUF3024 domain-containing protein [Pseudomonadota bacterium]
MGMHPNDVDRKRIEKALSGRARYRYVSPEVRAEEGGYRILSPCCSRNIDKEGGVIDIARLEYVSELRHWRLYHKDHALQAWKLYGEFGSLERLLQFLNKDPERTFWQ